MHKGQHRNRVLDRHRGLHRRRQRVLFEAVEKRLLFAVIDVSDFGATINDGRDDTASIQAAIRSSKAGDTIRFETGTYDLNEHLHIEGNRVYDGNTTTLKSHVGDKGWTMKIEGESKDVTIDGFHFEGGGIVAEGSENYKNLRITGNTFTNPASGNFWNNGPAIFLAQKNDGTVIQNNTFSDYSGYGAIIFSANRLDMSWNTFSNLDQAAHVINPGKDSSVSFNKVSGMVRMGFEIQKNGDHKAENLTVEGNVLTNWSRPWRDSFGLSIVPDGSINTRVINNYIQGVPRGWDGEWHERENGKHDGPRMGYGIEYGAKSGEVSGNFIGGAFANHIIISGGGGKHDQQIPVEDNKMYGTPLWRDWILTESYGSGNFGIAEGNNLKDNDYGDMPAPHRAGADAKSSKTAPKKPAANAKPKPAAPAVPPVSAPTASPPAPDTLPDTSQHHVAGDPMPAEPIGTTSTWLSDLRWVGASSGWGPVEIDQSNGERDERDGARLTINGAEYDKGLGVAINSEIVYRLDGKYERFFSDIGVDDYAGTKGSVTFEVWVDGRKVFDSGTMTGEMDARSIQIDVDGARELKLVTTDAGNGGRKDHADWAGARLTQDLV